MSWKVNKHCPEWSRTCVPLNLKLRWLNAKAFQNNTKNLRVTLRQNWKNISFAGKCTHAKPSESGPFYPVHFPHNVTWNLWKTFKAFFSRVINLLLTKLARDRTRRISALDLFCTDLAALGPYCQDLGPIFSQYGPRAWLYSKPVYFAKCVPREQAE